jgi:hypothetical protein
LWKIARTTRTIASASSAAKDPGRAAKRRARSKALGAVGFWRIVSKARGR